MLPIFGLASGVLSALAFLPYIRDTLRGQTSPHRASWVIWSVLASISFLSQVYEGASDSLWFGGVQTGGTIVVLGLAILFSRGALLDEDDRWILACAAIGLGLWAVTETSAYALAISISISLLGGMATVAKAYRNPHSETLGFWGWCFVASILAILSVGTLDWLLLAYPLYLFVLNGAIVGAILLGRSATQAPSAA